MAFLAEFSDMQLSTTFALLICKKAPEIGADDSRLIHHMCICVSKAHLKYYTRGVIVWIRKKTKASLLVTVL